MAILLIRSRLPFRDDHTTAYSIYMYGPNYQTRANVYQHGESESIIGEWMKMRGNRDEIVLATKYSSAWQGANPKVKIQSNFGGNNKKSMLTAIEATLQRLQTKYVDIVSSFLDSIQKMRIQVLAG